MNLGLFQREVAEKIEDRVCTVYNWERDIGPTIRHLPKIIEFLGLVPFDPPDAENVLNRQTYYKMAIRMSFKRLGGVMRRDPEQLEDWLSGTVKVTQKKLDRILRNYHPKEGCGVATPP